MSAGQPKALVEVHGRPFLEWQLAWMHAQGVRHVHLAAGYLGDAFRDWVRAARANDLPHVTVSVEPEPLGTGGGLAFAWSHCDAFPMFVANGDSLMPGLRLADFYNHFNSRSPNVIASVAVAHLDDASRFGTVEQDENGLISAFREKETSRAGWVNGGFYLMREEVRSTFPNRNRFSLEHDVFPALAASGRLAAYAADADLYDMGTPEGLLELRTYIERGQA